MNKDFKKVSVISGICVKNDAISASVRDDIRSLTGEYGFVTKLFTYNNEFEDLDTVIVRDVSEIIFNPFFISCDIIIYHFGIYYELFNAIFVGNGCAPQVVRYHNLTPASLLSASERRLSDRSIAQLHNLAKADEVWPVSDINRLELIENGVVPASKVQMIPLSVGNGGRRRFLLDKSFKTIRLLYVGRFVKAKGLLDLVRAARQLKDAGLLFQLRLVGEQRFSSPDFVLELKALIIELDLESEVAIIGGVGDRELEVEYDDAHILVIPSYHEGFCKPVIEAIRSGCLVVTYDGYNLQFVARQLSYTAPTGNIQLLKDRIEETMQTLLPACEGNGVGSIPTDKGRLSLDQYEMQANMILFEYGFPNVSSLLQKTASRLIAKHRPPNEGVLLV